MPEVQNTLTPRCPSGIRKRRSSSIRKRSGRRKCTARQCRTAPSTPRWPWEATRSSSPASRPSTAISGRLPLEGPRCASASSQHTPLRLSMISGST